MSGLAHAVLRLAVKLGECHRIVEQTLAGTSIVGVAVGFGAQNIVKDLARACS
jgi:hypothetical protein